MAQEGSEASVASTKTNSNLWDIHANSFSSWNNSWHHHPPNPNSNSCENNISISAANSFTNASNQSGLSVGSSAATQLSGEPAGDNHLWSQVLLSTGNGGEFHKNHNISRENFLEALSSKNLTTDMFGPACDYLKKLDESWEFTNSPSFTNLEKQLNSCNTTIINRDKSTNINLSDLVSNWSIAPPQPQPQFDQHGSTTALMEPNFSQSKHEMSHPLPYSNYGISERNNNSSMFAYGHEMKGESQQQEFGPSQPSFHRPISVGDQGLGYQVGGGGNSIGGSGGKYYLSDTPWSNTRNFSDLIKFGGSLNKQMMDPMAPKPCLKTGSPQSPDTKKQALHDSSSSVRGNMKITGNASDGKKKRSEDASDAYLKKPKHDNSNSSSTKLQVPKVKLGDKITALQQIVSPFGKTDTASVLLEAINYIKFLHEQVQLLSDPYMKAGANKDLNSWGGLERKEKQDIKLDLSNRGLCLVPISCTPEIYRENTGPDYWTPTYRGCLYR